MGKHATRSRRQGRRAAGPGSATGRTWAITRAFLAGGLVLAGGSVGSMTLASWTDDEVAQGTFSASQFALQSSLNNSTWTDHTVAAPAAMTFAGTGMSPSAVRYASIGIRTTTGSVPGTISLGGGVPTVTTDLTTALKYRVVAKSAPTCAVADFTTGTPVFVAGTSAAPVPLTTAGTGPLVVSGNQAAPVWLCFQVTMDANAANALQSAAASVVRWTVTGTSDP